MKRIIRIVTLLVLLSGCTQPVTITPDIVDVRYETIGFVEDNLVLDLYITNGTDESVTIDDIELWLELPEGIVLNDEETVFCGAVYTINQRIDGGSYAHFEVVFEPGYIFMTEDDLSTVDVTLNDLVLFYEFI